MKPRFFILALSAALLFGLAPTPGLRAQNNEDDAASAPSSLKSRHRSPGRDDQVMVMGDNEVTAGQTVQDAVAVMGRLTVDGHCLGDAVAIMGSNTINGTVDHDAVCVMGDLTLGPKAHIGGDVVCVMGALHRDPGAFVGGSVAHEIGIGPHLRFAPMHNWWMATLSHGQLLPIGPHVFWLWGLNLLMIGLYVLVAALFPAAMRRTGDMLVQRPLHVLLAGFLAILALPILFVLLLVTVVGIPVAIVLLPIAIFLLVYFGKASIYGLIGRKIVGEQSPFPLAVLVGGLIVLVLLACPYVCFVVYLVLGYLGFGCALTALLVGHKPLMQPGIQRVMIVPSVPPATPGTPTSPSAPAHSGAPTSGATTYPSPTFPASAGVTAQPSVSSSIPAYEPSVSGTPAYPAPHASGTPPVSGMPAHQAPSEPGAPTYPTPNFPESAGGTAEPSASSSIPAYGTLPPPVIPSATYVSAPSAPLLDATLPRAPFWIRTGAMAIDALLICIAMNIVDHRSGPGLFLFLLATYAAVMWKLRGTTVGGLICHLHVVRLDGRPIDWPTAIVRALGCFVSLFPLGLGFIWVAFDPERQSWHDKLAGTTVVISVTRRSLV